MLHFSLWRPALFKELAALTKAGSQATRSKDSFGNRIVVIETEEPGQARSKACVPSATGFYNTIGFGDPCQPRRLPTRLALEPDGVLETSSCNTTRAP